MRILSDTAVAAVSLSMVLGVGCVRIRPAGPNPVQYDSVGRALGFFASFLRRYPSGDLSVLRPPPASRSQIEAAVLSLPLQGNLEPEANEARKIAGLRPILTYHDRQNVVRVRLVDVPDAAFGFHARAVLLLSRPAVTILSLPELQAAAAHELGHEYFWVEYHDARRRYDVDTLRELELKCDGIAVLTLQALHIDPSALMSGLAKLTKFNEFIGAELAADRYPSLADRHRFVRAVLELER